MKLQTMKKEKASAINEQDFERAARLRDEQKELQTKLDDAKKKWQEQQKGNSGEVTAEDIAKDCFRMDRYPCCSAY